MQEMIKRGKPKLNKHVNHKWIRKTKETERLKHGKAKKWVKECLELIPQKQKLFGLILTIPVVNLFTIKLESD